MDSSPLGPLYEDSFDLSPVLGLGSPASTLNTPIMSPIQSINGDGLIPELIPADKVNKDEKMAREARIKISVQDIISLSIDEFNDLLSKNTLSEDQYKICRDIRKRGKNKIAAQTCRQRKSDQIEELRGRLQNEQNTTSRLKKEYEGLVVQRKNAADELNNLINNILISRNLSPQHYTVEGSIEEVYIVRKILPM